MLAVGRSELAREWVRPAEEKDKHRTPENTSAGSGIPVIWRCEKKGHDEWSATVIDRALKGSGCPECRDEQRGIVGRDKSLAATHPHLIGEWARPANEKDAYRTPENTSAGAKLKLIWDCGKGHKKWSATVKSRALDGKGCPVCNSKGWDRPYLQQFLIDSWDKLEACGTEDERRDLFESAGALKTDKRQRSIIEAVIKDEFTDEDLAAYTAGEDTPAVTAVLEGHAGALPADVDTSGGRFL